MHSCINAYTFFDGVDGNAECIIIIIDRNRKQIKNIILRFTIKTDVGVEEKTTGNLTLEIKKVRALK